jgi:hypothetical protein
MDASHHSGIGDCCGCCEPAASPTPVQISNRPGLSAIAYRVGTFASFREAMLEAIGRQPALAGLTTRRSDDPAITVLELWAAVADVLTFYQERIANEAYLRTARERDSVLRLARLLDYHLRPGLAATAHLAFTADDGATVRIPVGLRVMSTPGQDERPQIFETVEAITADSRLNRIAVLPKPDAAPPLSSGQTATWLRSDDAGLQAARDLSAGDKVVLFDLADGMKMPEEKEVGEVRPDGNRFRLVWTSPIVNDWRAAAQARVFQRQLKVFGHDAPPTFPTAFYIKPPPTNLPKAFDWIPQKIEYTDFELSGTELPLDAVYKDLSVGDELLVSERGITRMRAPDLVQITALTVRDVFLPETLPGPPSSNYTGTSLADHRHRSTVTVATLDQSLTLWDRRNVSVYHLKRPAIPIWGADVLLKITAGPLYIPAVPVDDETVEIGRTLDGREIQPGEKIRLDEIAKGRTVLLEDQARKPIVAEISDPPFTETIDQQFFLVLPVASLSPIDLDARSAVLLGNVARATHGETVPDEILGDGNAAIPFQKLALHKPPLTYVPSADTAHGTAALRILVNGEAWREVPSLFGQPPSAPVYTARQEDDGTTVLQFGDGVTGARLPTGRGNVIATYRQGSGLEGLLKADQLNILLDRPVGLGDAVNPAPTEGGADPEVREDARQAAPTTVRTFGRAVSLRDFEWLALESGQVARAKATWVWRGLEKAVHLTVAGQRGGILSPEALKTLHAALSRQRDPNHPLLLANVCRVPIEIEARVGVEDRFVRDAVARAARQALLQSLDFEHVGFAQSIHRSDLYRVLQEVPGVLFVDLDRLHFKDRSEWDADGYLARGADAGPLQEHVRIFAARPGSGSTLKDPIVKKDYGSSPPEVLPAEQAFLEMPSQDVRLTFQGGLDR